MCCIASKGSGFGGAKWVWIEIGCGLALECELIRWKVEASDLMDEELDFLFVIHELAQIQFCPAKPFIVKFH